jgi:hypothetical protein
VGDAGLEKDLGDVLAVARVHKHELRLRRTGRAREREVTQDLGRDEVRAAEAVFKA